MRLDSVEASVGNVNEQVTAMGSWSSLPLGNLSEDVGEQVSKLSHLRARVLGSLPTNCNLFLVEGCC